MVMRVVTAFLGCPSEDFLLDAELFLLAVESFLIRAFVGVELLEVLLLFVGGFSATDPSPVAALTSEG